MCVPIEHWQSCRVERIAESCLAAILSTHNCALAICRNDALMAPDRDVRGPGLISYLAVAIESRRFSIRMLGRLLTRQVVRMNIECVNRIVGAAHGGQSLGCD